MAENRIGIIKLDTNKYGSDEVRVKSLSDLKLKIQKEDKFTVIKFLIKEVIECDIDTDVYFKIRSTTNVQELYKVIEILLKVANSRKYDENARHMLYVIKSMLDKQE